MLTHHAAIVKDTNRFVGTFKVVEPNSGTQRREHGKRPISILTSRSVLTLTRATEVNQLTFSPNSCSTRCDRTFDGSLRHENGKHEVKNPSLPRALQDFDQKWSPLLQQNGGTQALLSATTPRSINITNVT